MRTIEETREFIKTWLKKIEDDDTRQRFAGTNCPGCLAEILEFIESEPRCTHPLRRIGYIANGVYESSHATFCPDRGERLIPEAA